MAVILLAVVGKAAGDATEAAGGQWMSTAAGSLSGSLNTMRSSSVGLISPRGKDYFGHWDLASLASGIPGPVGVPAPTRAAYLIICSSVSRPSLIENW